MCPPRPWHTEPWAWPLAGSAPNFSFPAGPCLSDPLSARSPARGSAISEGQMLESQSPARPPGCSLVQAPGPQALVELP